MRVFAYFTIIAFSLLSAAAAFSDSGIATIRGIAPGSPISGEALFEDTPGGLKITVDLQGAPPGKHGFHIHEFGLLTNGGNDAGGHFNPAGKPHGYLPSDGLDNAHAGDLGNIEIGPDGKGSLALTIPGLTLSGGPASVGGRSVILHAKEDDFGQPVGNAGPRIGGGVIVLKARL